MSTYGSASDTNSSSANGSDSSAGISATGSTSSTNPSTSNTNIDTNVSPDSSTNGSDANVGDISTSSSNSSTNSSSINTNVDTNNSTVDFNTTSGSASSSNPEKTPSVTPSATISDNGINTATGSAASNSEELPATTPSTTGPDDSTSITSGSVTSNSQEIPAATPSPTKPGSGSNTIASGSVDSNSNEISTATPSATNPDSSSSFPSVTMDSNSKESSTAVRKPTLPPLGSESEGTNEDNVITGVDTVEPSQTNPATSTGENIIRPSDGSAHQLDSNNGASGNSSWSGSRLTTVLTIMGAVAAVAVIAVFVAVRKEANKSELGTPSEDYTDDDSSVTPMTHHLDGKYQHSSYARRSTDLSGNTPLASIVVIGPDDDFHTPNAYTSTHQYRSYDVRSMRSASVNNDPVQEFHRENTTAAIPEQQRLDAEHDSIFDSSNTRVSFSSSSEPPSFEFEDNLTQSCLMVSAISINDSERGSDVSTAPRQRQVSSRQVSSVGDEDDAVSNLTRSFGSSLSSLESSQYDARDTEASEHIYESELCTNSSRVAMSFDVGSV
ncbi:hypothetical protein PHMEG_00021918 [Phytophthora megakarya]|uniref:Uncharacterized protein n=1 Tax=Phytophthora megakarya TaxID=4795 RepID=A0A225VKN9_9STRA|nr:hypothetical protein PHMEG_00021918 [Phytophthora megakarya]